jgi:hypothetical protein
MDEKADQGWLENAQNNGESTTRVKSKLEKRLLLKMDVSIVPLLGLSFFIAYMVCECLSTNKPFTDIY